MAGLTGDDSQILFLVTSLDTGRVSYQKFAVLGDAPQDDKVSAVGKRPLDIMAMASLLSCRASINFLLSLPLLFTVKS